MSRLYFRLKRFLFYFMEFFSEVIVYGARLRLSRSTYSFSVISRLERVVKVSRSILKSFVISVNR